MAKATCLAVTLAIDFKKPEEVPKKLNKHERRIFIIQGLIDCGYKKAKILIDRFETPFDVIMAIKDTKILYTRTSKPKGISGPLEDLKGFGYKFVEKNQEILFGIEQDLSVQKLKTAQTTL